MSCARRPSRSGSRAHRALQLADHVGVPAEREVGVDAPLSATSRSSSSRALSAAPRLVGELAERRAAPQRERVAQRRRGALGSSSAARGGRLESCSKRVDIERVVVDDELVGVTARASTSPAGRPRRSCETRFCTTLAAVAGAAPPHSSSTIRSADTRRLRSTTRSASSSR